MFKDVEQVASATDKEIKEVVAKSYNVSLSDILDSESADILEKAREIEIRAEKIAFAIRDRFNAIVEDEEPNEDEDSEDDEDEDAIDEFMNEVASMLGQEYNSEYEYRPDAFWIQSTC